MYWLCVCVKKSLYTLRRMSIGGFHMCYVSVCVCLLKCTSTVCIGCVGICLHLDFSIKFLTSHCNQCD